LRVSDDAEGAPAIRNRVMIRIPGRTVRHRLDLPGDRAAAFDLDRAVADFAADPAGGADGQAVFHHEVAVETTGDIGRFDLSVTLEDAGIGDFDGADVRERGLHPALDDQPFAGLDLAGEHDLAANMQPLAVGVDRWSRLGAPSGGRRDLGQPARPVAIERRPWRTRQRKFRPQVLWPWRNGIDAEF